MTKIYTEEQLEEFMYSEAYAEFIMENSKGDRVICNGHMLLDAQEHGYLFDEFLISLED